MDKIRGFAPPLKNCPPEILLMIFEKLDVLTLINCMSVCKKWWSICNNIFKRIGWYRVVESALMDKGAAFRKKSSLDICDTILNLSLWQEIHLARPQNNYIYKIQEVLNLNIYRDNIIVVTNWEVKYFDIRNHKLLKTLPITCVDFDENDHMFVKVEKSLTTDSKIGNYKKLTLYGKENVDSGLDVNKAFSYRSILYHRLQENCCYFTISEYCIFVSKWAHNTWTTKLVARYFGFGTIIDINVYQEDTFALLNWGGLLQVDHGGVKFKMNKRKRSSVVLEIPKYSYDVTLYGKNGAIAAVPFDKPFCLKLNEPAYWVLECPDLSCTLKHGNMIILGYNTGKVEIFNPSLFHQKKITQVSPQLSLSVHKLAGEDVPSPRVQRLDVAEAGGGHVLFIATTYYIFQTTLGYRLTEQA